jgi:hypothetical protein
MKGFIEVTEKRETFRSKIRYFIRLIRWLYKHRAEQNCRQKWRRMERELNRNK